MKKIITVIGARPQIIKASAISRAIQEDFKNELQEIIVHTGQHYDHNMSQVFFDELGIPEPNYNLDIKSGSHGEQTAKMIQGLEEIIIKENPVAIILYGDTNSTLAGAIAASKIDVPIVHVEAGLRSFNKRMPEEINRIMCDHVSTLLFSPTKTGYNNLLNEGMKADNQAPFDIDNPKIYHSGDVMYDNSLHFSNLSDQKSTIIQNLGLDVGKFILCTIHRNYNTDNKERLTSIFDALDTVASQSGIAIVLPLHPRTKKLMATHLTQEVFGRVSTNNKIKIIDPVSFLDMIALEKNSVLIATDSGGVQKEAYFFKRPCVIMRSETEWVELVENGTATIADANKEKIVADSLNFLNNRGLLNFPPIFGDGKTGAFICKEILSL